MARSRVCSLGNYPILLATEIQVIAAFGAHEYLLFKADSDYGGGR